MHPTPTDAELTAYLAGQLTPARQLEIDHWIARDPAHAAHIDVLRTLLADPGPGGWNRERIWQRLEREIAESRAPAARVVVARPSVAAAVADHRGWWSSKTAIAAAAAVILAVSATQVRRWTSASPSPEHLYTTRRGETVTIRLSDGSQVTLAPESELRVPARFGEGVRAIELTGEGVFEVVHDSTRAFRVTTAHAVVVDVGTRFDVHAYPRDSVTRVAVTEGAVTLGPRSIGTDPPANNRAEGVLVSHGQMAVLDPSGHTRAGPIDDAAAYFAWTTGRLVFTRAPLREVLATVARWHDVAITIADPALEGRLVTADFSTQSPAEIVRGLARAVGVPVSGSAHSFTLGSR